MRRAGACDVVGELGLGAPANLGSVVADALAEERDSLGRDERPFAPVVARHGWAGRRCGVGPHAPQDLLARLAHRRLHHDRKLVPAGAFRSRACVHAESGGGRRRMRPRRTRGLAATAPSRCAHASRRGRPNTHLTMPIAARSGVAPFVWTALARRCSSTLRDVDLDRADLVARAAQRRRVRQRRRVLDADQLRREDRADRAGVDRAVRVTARARVDGTHVEAGAAADAVQRLPADLIGEHPRPPVVEQHDVQLLRARRRR